jgi:hypothetical protein
MEPIQKKKKNPKRSVRLWTPAGSYTHSLLASRGRVSQHSYTLIPKPEAVVTAMVAVVLSLEPLTLSQLDASKVLNLSHSGNEGKAYQGGGCGECVRILRCTMSNRANSQDGCMALETGGSLPGLRRAQLSGRALRPFPV